jgi:hypothetical protein
MISTQSCTCEPLFTDGVNNSSDVLDQTMRITVEDSNGALWYKVSYRNVYTGFLLTCISADTRADGTRNRRQPHGECGSSLHMLITHGLIFIQDCKTNRVRWTIHQPKRGWYLRLRSPTFPPGASISLTPLTNNRDEHGNIAHNNRSTDPKLTFGCQTIVPTSVVSNALPDHSYPPSRTSTSSQTSISASSSRQSLHQERRPPVRKSQAITASAAEEGTHESEDIGDGLKSVETGSSTPSKPAPPRSVPMPKQPPLKWQVTHYSLQLGVPENGHLAGIHHHHPHLAHAPSHAPQTSFLSRALAPLANISHATSYHFTIQPLFIPGMGNAAAAVGRGTSSNAPSATPVPVPLPLPFVAFTDSTPVLRATPSGTLSIDVEVVRSLGVEMAFWVAVSLAFFDFLRDRDVRECLFIYISI